MLAGAWWVVAGGWLGSSPLSSDPGQTKGVHRWRKID